jgi:succinylglutamate desuccinylase
VRYDIHDRTFYDLHTATRKLLALDELNNEKEDTSYHLQVVDTYLDNSKDTVVMANGSHNIDTI